jgi:hypothetical protein
MNILLPKIRLVITEHLYVISYNNLIDNSKDLIVSWRYQIDTI